MTAALGLVARDWPSRDLAAVPVFSSGFRRRSGSRGDSEPVVSRVVGVVLSACGMFRELFEGPVTVGATVPVSSTLRRFARAIRATAEGWYNS